MRALLVNGRAVAREWEWEGEREAALGRDGKEVASSFVSGCIEVRVPAR